MDPTRVFNFFTFFERILYKSNCIIFIFSWCGAHTKIRSKLVAIVTAGSQKTTLWGPQRTPLGLLRVNTKQSSVLIDTDAYTAKFHVPEGLGMLSCSLILKMKLVPPSLPRSSYVSSPFCIHAKYRSQNKYTVPIFWVPFCQFLLEEVRFGCWSALFFHAVPSKTEAYYLGTRFSVPCLSFHVLCYQPSCHYCSHLTILLNLVSTDNFSLPLITTDNFSVTNSPDVLIMSVGPFNYEIVSHA